MKILIDIHDQSWMPNCGLAEVLGQKIDIKNIELYPEIEREDNIVMLVCDRLRPGLAGRLPGLKLVQKLGAGVDSMIFDPDLPQHVRITRLKHEETATEMAGYCLAHVLTEVHHLAHYRDRQAQRKWSPREPLVAGDIQIGVLGLGHIGSAVARLFAQSGFEVCGWSRTEKSIDGVRCSWGDEAMAGIFASSDYLVCVLPATPDTRELFNADTFAGMKPGSTLLNIGRGSLVNEDDLLAALDRGCPGRAVLDVFQEEPLPRDNALWFHPGVTVTPHVSGWHLEGGLPVIAENYRRLMQGQALVNEVNRILGY